MAVDDARCAHDMGTRSTGDRRARRGNRAKVQLRGVAEPGDGPHITLHEDTKQRPSADEPEERYLLGVTNRSR